jgi:hypothetical protein
LKGTGFSLKGTGFSLKGTGFSPYIKFCLFSSGLYSSFGITVDRKRELKWPFSQEKATLHTVNEDHTNSETALAPEGIESQFELSQSLFQQVPKPRLHL